MAAIIRAFCEVHPLLRIANLYVEWPVPSTVDGGDNVRVRVQVSVASNTISLKDAKSGAEFQINFPVSIKLLAGCIDRPTSVEQGGRFLHLRMPTVPPLTTRGSENTEVISLPDISTMKTLVKKKIYIPESAGTYRLQCSHCGAIFVETVQFQRVLPLPSSSWSEGASDWYCHLHATDDLKQQKLEPRMMDCLFSSCYYTISTSLLDQQNVLFNSNNNDSSRQQVTCGECSAEVAVVRDEKLKMWCHAVQWLSHDPRRSAALWQPEPKITALEAFHSCLVQALDEEMSFFGRRLAFDDLATGQTLSVWFVGDTGLCLEQHQQQQPIESCSSDRCINLVANSKVRVLYKLSDSSSSSSSDADGQKMSDVSRYEISSAMFADAARLLIESSLCLPPSCRTWPVAGFSIGFLCTS